MLAAAYTSASELRSAGMEMWVTVEELLSRTGELGLNGEAVRQVWPRLLVERLPLAFMDTRLGGAGSVPPVSA